jgi:hypothetical protein
MDVMKRERQKTKDKRNKIRIPSWEGQGVGSFDLQDTINRRK